MRDRQRRLAAIVFTDIYSYSASMGKNEALTLDLLEEHRQLLRSIFRKYQGKEVETTGDSFFVIFVSTLQAVHCAMEIQTKLPERNLKEPPERQILIRIGLHVGDVVHMGKNVHGDKVNITARIQSVANPGGICLSEDMEQQIRGQIGARTEELGKSELKNIEIPMEVWRVVMPWEESRFSWSERVKFRLKQKRAQQMILVTKTLLISTILILAGLCIWQWIEKKKDIAVESKAGTGFKPALTEEVSPLNKHRIAVLPFVNLSGEEEDEYFVDGMMEEMISQLWKISGLEVIARTSVMAYKGPIRRLMK
jgi:class 3 adenylate cyclase